MADVFRTPDERFGDLDGYPFEPSYLDLAGDLAGLRLHFVDEGEGDPILLLHGEPTWAYLYRKMIPALADSGRVVAPDYIGFGRSDKVTDIGWYSYDRHVDSIEQLVEELDLTGITIVVQDWGDRSDCDARSKTPTGLRGWSSSTPASSGPGPNWPSEGFLQWRNFAERNPDLPIGFVLQGATTTELSDATVAGYEAPFPTPESKAGAAAFPLMVPISDEDPGAKEMAEVSEALARWEKPTLVTFSDSDPVFPLPAGERMAERIPGAGPFVPIEGASHFLQEDKGEQIAAVIPSFLENS
jgi:haloalkane dehalogenase